MTTRAAGAGMQAASTGRPARNCLQPPCSLPAATACRPAPPTPPTPPTPRPPTLARFSSRRVRACQLRAGRSGELCRPMRALVLQGLPTTSILQSREATWGGWVGGRQAQHEPGTRSAGRHATLHARPTAAPVAQATRLLSRRHKAASQAAVPCHPPTHLVQRLCLLHKDLAVDVKQVPAGGGGARTGQSRAGVSRGPRSCMLHALAPCPNVGRSSLRYSTVHAAAPRLPPSHARAVCQLTCAPCRDHGAWHR